MVTRPEPQSDELLALEQLTSSGPDALPLEEQVEAVRLMRRQAPQASERLDRFFLAEVGRLRAGLAEARSVHVRLTEVVERLTATPWHLAILLGLSRDDNPSALVQYNGSRRVVALAHDVDPRQLVVGDEVLLGQEFNVIVATSPHVRRTGTVATFDRATPDGRLVIRHRDEEVMVEASGRLAASGLQNGDLVRWDQHVGMVFERVERSEGPDRFLEKMPAETFALVGGLDRQIEQLQRSIRLHLYHPEVVRKYGLRRKGSVLLVGPPGTGKTLLAKALANWVGQISRSGRSRFINIKPAGLHEMWYGKTEENYRQAFRVARDAGAAEPDVPVVMFFDEVDAIGSTRGGSFTRTDDRVLNALMAELDGLEARGNILVVAATNRRDALDPALLRPGRLGDLELEVPRPGMSAARAIFGKYLLERLTYRSTTRRASPPGDGDAEDIVESIVNDIARRQVIEAAVSAIYAPNADNLLATLTLRDGKQRPVRAADLMSGASIAKIAADAAERAGLRAIEEGEAAIGADDLHAAIADELTRLARVLTPLSCRQHLADLPHEVDVVRVEPTARLGRSYRYINVA